MPGHTFLYSPPVNHDPRPDPVGRARRDLLHLDEPREPRSPPAGRQRRLGPRAARLLDPALLARRDAAPCVRARAAAASSPASPTSPSSTSSSPSGTIAHVELSWLAPSKLRRTTIVGSRKMVVYDDTSNEPVRVFDSGVDAAATRRRSASTGSPTARATSSRRGSTPPSRSRSSWPTSARRSGRATTPRSSADRARGRADDRGGRHARSPRAAREFRSRARRARCLTLAAGQTGPESTSSIRPSPSAGPSTTHAPFTRSIVEALRRRHQAAMSFGSARHRVASAAKRRR